MCIDIPLKTLQSFCVGVFFCILCLTHLTLKDFCILLPSSLSETSQPRLHYFVLHRYRVWERESDRKTVRRETVNHRSLQAGCQVVSSRPPALFSIYTHCVSCLIVHPSLWCSCRALSTLQTFMTYLRHHTVRWFLPYLYLKSIRNKSRSPTSCCFDFMGLFRWSTVEI